MLETKKVFLTIFIVALICIVVSACSEAAIPDETMLALTSTPTTRPAQTETPKATATSTLLPTKIPTQTQEPSPTETPGKPITPTMTSSPEPTISSSPTPVPAITNRQPSLEELELYVSGLALEEDPIGHTIKVTYEDVNGDGEDDLILSDYLFVGVFLWQGNQYEGAFVYQGYPWKYDPGSRVTLEDWTDDNVPEIVFDFREDTGGTGVRVTDWTRYVIHCVEMELSCQVIWAGKLGALGEEYNSGGISLLQTSLEHTRDIHDAPILEVQSDSFAIDAWGALPYSSPIGDGVLTYDSGRKVEGYPESSPLEPLKIYTSTKDIFIWNGSQYEWQETEILTPYVMFDSQAKLEAFHTDGIIATITFKSNNDAGLKNDICQLNMDGQKVGLEFGCKHNFTQLKWQDVTGDNIEELVITAFSNVYSDAGFEGEGDSPDKDCIHQRMFIYRQIDSEMKKIADVTGCVVESDLYGVRFEDIDGDGQVEILAADGWFTDSRCFSVLSSSGPDGKQKNCWYELGYQNEVYKWNGSEFVYSGLLGE